MHHLKMPLPASWRKLSARKPSFGRWLFIGGAGCCAIAMLAYAAKPAYRAIRGYRVDENLHAAMAAQEAEDWGLARDKARSVLLIQPGHFEACRIWTRALAQMNERRTGIAAYQMFADPRATRADRLEALQVLARQGPQAVALACYDRLPKDLRNQGSFRAAIVPLLIQRGDTDLAENGLRQVADAADDPVVRLELLHALCSHPNPARVAEARKLFAAWIAANANQQALAALLILGETTGGLAPGSPLPDLPAWLAHQPKARPRHQLLGLDPALAAQPGTADRVYQAACGRFLTEQPGVLGDWLIRHGQATRAATILEEQAKSRPDAYFARMRALQNRQAFLECVERRLLRTHAGTAVTRAGIRHRHGLGNAAGGCGTGRIRDRESRRGGPSW